MSIYILSISILSLIQEMYREKTIVHMLELLTCVEFCFLSLLVLSFHITRVVLLFVRVYKLEIAGFTFSEMGLLGLYS